MLNLPNHIDMIRMIRCHNKYIYIRVKRTNKTNH